MTYYFSNTLDIPFDAAMARATEALKREGFGVLTTIDVRETFREKLGVDFPHYVILGACNPTMAHQALLAENKIGTMLPCNVIVRENGDGRTEVAAVDPVSSMQAVQNPSLSDIASTVRTKLEKVIESLDSLDTAQ